MKTCIYCGFDKEDDDFSDEHIWPDALGGDHLSPFWRTDDVCRSCNTLSGVFVDGAFIKSWAGAAERAIGSHEHLAVNSPESAVLPLNYIGKIPNAAINNGEVAEFWIGPCGAHIVHIRPEDNDEAWKTYAGGDPRRSRKRSAGRVYMALTSNVPFWIVVSLASFNAHFRRADRFVTNMAAPPGADFKNPDRTNPEQANDMALMDTIRSAGQTGEFIHTQHVVSLDLGGRLLSKLGLAIGYKLFGGRFFDIEYAKILRAGFREANPEKRRTIPVKGTGFLQQESLGGAEAVMKWPGAWVLLLKVVGAALVLTVITPSSRTMSVVICEDSKLLAELDPAYTDGQTWLTIPSLGEAAGPIPLPSYLGHQTNSYPLAELVALASKRINPDTLPPCMQQTEE